jgi:hypothetical protein
MWTCPKCGEKVEGQFDSCWSCGTKRDGTPPAKPPQEATGPSPTAPSTNSSSAFLKGGCGCLVVFAALAFIAVLLGGHAHANVGGVVLLFVIGGILGLVVLSIYNKGRKAAIADAPPPKPSDKDA